MKYVHLPFLFNQYFQWLKLYQSKNSKIDLNVSRPGCENYSTATLNNILYSNRQPLRFAFAGNWLAVIYSCTAARNMPARSINPKENTMSDEEFVTSHDTLKLADEVACLKMMVTLILKGMGQADAGKVIINMERYVQTLGDKPQAEVFSNTIKQIKTAYRQ
jgi:hypothetical protein